jgi:hypothetical protein
MDILTQTDHLNPILNIVCPSDDHQKYFRSVVQIDRRFEGVVMRDVVHAGKGLFISSPWNILGSMPTGIKQEEIDGGVTVNCVRVPHHLINCISIMLLMKGV